MTNIMWFRSDLRISDNPALYAAAQDNADVTVRAVFFVTLAQWQNKHNWGANKIGFVLANVLHLRDSLAKYNIPLDLEYCDNFAELPKALLDYITRHKAKSLYFNQEYEVNEVNRDVAVVKLFKAAGIECQQFEDQCLLIPRSILTKSGTPYTIFTPFKKACLEHISRHPIRLTANITKQKNIDVLENQQDKIRSDLNKFLTNPILKNWPSGEKYAQQRLQDFCEHDLFNYSTSRDVPALDATSSLSPYLAIGVISVRQCFIAACHQNHGEHVSGDPNITCWISELIWRDFYRHIIVHYPSICKGYNFNRKYDKVKWLPAKDHLSKWQQGQTGIPIIDAAMQQLVTTGWMHNRLRMIVAMFLSKNLLIDWRHGEKFFSQHLIDLDFASNNGGWQWSASTGTDAAPYFRIFNPIAQSEKFDPHGEFIKKYCPQLAELNATQIHNPSLALTQDKLHKLGYPRIMVDLKVTRARAIEAFKG